MSISRVPPVSPVFELDNKDRRSHEEMADLWKAASENTTHVDVGPAVATQSTNALPPESRASLLGDLVAAEKVERARMEFNNRIKAERPLDAVGSTSNPEAKPL